MAFATPADMEARWDARSLGDLVADTGANVDPTTLLSDANLQACLDDAAGDIVSALVSNQHYTEADLNGLSGYSHNLLVRLNCVLALQHLLGRRLYNQDEIAKRIPEFTWANDLLERLKNGARVFNIAKNVQSGVMYTTQIGANTTQLGMNRKIFGTTQVNCPGRYGPP